MAILTILVSNQLTRPESSRGNFLLVAGTLACLSTEREKLTSERKEWPRSMVLVGIPGIRTQGELGPEWKAKRTHPFMQDERKLAGIEAVWIKEEEEIE